MKRSTVTAIRENVPSRARTAAVSFETGLPECNEGKQHSTAQHSTAQHSTAQHSTAQHSTADAAYFLLN